MMSRRNFAQSAAAVGALAIMTAPRYGRAQGRETTLRVVWPFDTSSLDPVGIGVQRSTWAVSWHVYDRLVSYAVDDQPDGTRQYDPARLTGELAESWDVTDGGRTVTFRLRQGARFHDGTPVTAEDARWSIARALSVPAAAGVMRIGGLSDPQQLAVVDDHTLRVALAAPNRYSIAVFSIPFAAIVNARVARGHATPQDPWANEWLRHNAAGGGAFKIASFRSDQVILARNDAWTSGPVPALRQAVFQTVPESATRAALVERGAADVAFEIPPNEFGAIAQRRTANALAIPMRNHMDFVAFNSQQPPFDDVRVRQAVAFALPYDQIFQGVFGGRGVPLYGGPADPRPALFPQPHAFRYEPERARALLRAAGREQGFETTLSYSISKAGFFDPLALAIRDALGRVGIRVAIERLPGAQFGERAHARSMPMLLDNQIAWLSLPDYWMSVFYTGRGTSNFGNFADARLEAMLRALPPDAPPDVYGEKTREMAKLVLTEVPLLPLRQGALEVVLARGLAGFTYWFHGLPDARGMRRA